MSTDAATAGVLDLFPQAAQAEDVRARGDAELVEAEAFLVANAAAPCRRLGALSHELQGAAQEGEASQGGGEFSEQLRQGLLALRTGGPQLCLRHQPRLPRFAPLRRPGGRGGHARLHLVGAGGAAERPLPALDALDVLQQSIEAHALRGTACLRSELGGLTPGFLRRTGEFLQSFPEDLAACWRRQHSKGLPCQNAALHRLLCIDDVVLTGIQDSTALLAGACGLGPQCLFAEVRAKYQQPRISPQVCTAHVCHHVVVEAFLS
mmetsp:Transcript_153678/g.492647  ORF Transcript_153678/g.492647 Transcript_153678/m.492647 type:complete len:264 (-) Transcript_153678:1997-2788(-)